MSNTFKIIRYNDAVVTSEIVTWCIEEFGVSWHTAKSSNNFTGRKGQWSIYHNTTWDGQQLVPAVYFTFSNNNDAILFKLIWGSYCVS